MKYSEKLIKARKTDKNGLLNLLKNNDDIYIVANVANNTNCDLNLLHYIYENFEANSFIYTDMVFNKNIDKELLFLLVKRIIEKDELHNQVDFFESILSDEKVDKEILIYILNNVIFYYTKKFILAFFRNINIDEDIARKLLVKASLNEKIKLAMSNNKNLSNDFLKEFININDKFGIDLELSLIKRKFVKYDDTTIRMMRL